jgi:hypothetical protein
MLQLLSIILMTMSTTPVMIYDFSANDNLKGWFIVNDDVMGGRSKSTFEISPNQTGIFKGTVSLENNGGFASIHYRFPLKKIGEAKTLRLYVKGDGRKYQARIYASASDYYSYISYFQTNGEWQHIDIPLAEMYPSFRGRKLDMPKFSSSSIEEVALLIGNKKAETFKLEIGKIELY